MDEIQKVLIQQGRKDLAKLYFDRVAATSKITFINYAEMKNVLKMLESQKDLKDLVYRRPSDENSLYFKNDYAKRKAKELIEKKNLGKFVKKMNKQASTRYQNGLTSVSREFSSLLVPIAQYTFTNIINGNPPIIATNTEYNKKVGLLDVQTDVNKTAVCVNGITAIYPDKIITGYTRYGDYIVTAYCKTREEAKDWIDRFSHEMMTKNQYRGKCLYAEGGQVEFKEVPDTNWDDVVLSEKVKKDIRLNTVAFLGDQKLAMAGVSKRGLVMYGPPGTGKTSVVKAIFKELEGRNATRIYVTAESFKRMSVGNLFDLLPYLGKTVLAFEDIDMIGTSRDIQLGSGLLGDLLTNLDGMRKYKDPLVVMASTNKVSMLDEALANRPCRFDRKIEIGLPGDDHLRKIYMKLMSAEINDDVIKLSKDFTGSHAVEAVNTAKILAASEGKAAIDCLREACGIIRENFFPGQDQIQLKAAVQAHLIKKGFKIKMMKTASVQKKAAMIADEIIVDTKIYGKGPNGELIKKTIWERYINDDNVGIGTSTPEAEINVQ